MIFPSSGQTVHNVLLSFPDKNEGKRKEKKVPKLIRTDSEKCIPVTEVENTNEGAKLKFVHNGIRMVVYDDSKLSKQQIRDSTRKLPQPNAQTTKVPVAAPRAPNKDPNAASRAPSLRNPPQMHIHTSDELMPNFMGKMTVGKYSPEKAASQFHKSLITDSFSHISTVNQTHSHSHIGINSHVGSADGDELLLDQYLNIHSYSPVNDVTEQTGAELNSVNSRTSSRGLRSTHHNSGSDLKSLNEEKDSFTSPKKESPKRVEVPLLFGLSPTNSIVIQQSPESVKEIETVLPTPSPAAKLTSLDKEENEETGKGGTGLVFNDSAPPSASAMQRRTPLHPDGPAGAPGATASAALVALEPIEDAPSPAMISRAVSNLTDANLGDFTHRSQIDPPSVQSTPQNATHKLLQLPSEYGFESIGLASSQKKRDSPTASSKSYEMSAQINLQSLQYKVVNAAVPACIPPPDLKSMEWGEELTTVSSEAGASALEGGNTKTPISAVVVRVEGTTVSPVQEELAGFSSSLEMESLENTARSFGLDSLSALSDSMSNLNDEDIGRGRSNSQTTTRATLLREQSTKAALTRMDSGPLRQQKGPVYTSKTSVGSDASVSSEARERVKKKLVNAARLIVAFRPAQKGKVVVGKDGIANESIAFAIKSVQQETTTTNIATATTALKKDPVSERPPVVNRARSMSLMTDSVDDSPRGTENGIPTPTSMQQQQPPTIFSGRRANETPRRTVEPLAASKQNLFDFKPPEEVASKQLLAKKSTGSFLSKLKERVGKDKADLVEQLVEAAEEDDDSVVTSYFDHNAAPIFVEREKVEKHVLHSKRFDKPLEGKEYRSKYGVGEDDESVDEGTCPIDGYTGGRARSRSESGPRQDVHADQQDHYQEGGERDFDGAEGADGAFNGARFAAGSSKSGKAATAAKVIIKPQFDLGKFLNGVSEEERVALEGLPQEAVNQIMEGMNTSLGGKGKGVVNKKNLAYFKNLIEKMKRQQAELDRLNMDIQVELLDASDRAISVSASSVHGGNVIIICTVDTAAQMNRPYSIMNVGAVEALEGLVSFECREIQPNSMVDVSFANLRPETAYIVYVIADSTQAKQVPLTDEDKAPVQVVVNTLQESLDIEWHRLSTEMQLTEIRAALRTTWLREAAAALYPPISLPADENVQLEEFAASPPGAAAELVDAPKKMSPKTNRKGSSAPASALKGRLSEAEEQNKNTWRRFLDWWVGQSSLMVTKIRSEFQLKEALFAGQQEFIKSKYLESGLASKEEVELLCKYCANMAVALATGKVRKDIFPVSREFRKFRSWYKGGQIVRDSVEASLAERSDELLQKSIETFTSVVTEKSALVSSALDAQLVLRTQFLQSRIDDVEVCKDIVKDLVSAHFYGQEHSLVEDDLLFKRSQLSPQDLMAIMSSKRLAQLCVDCGVISSEKDLAGVPVDAFGQAGKFNYMTIAGSDLFKILNLRTLRPDDPPLIVMETLPGTNRKPLKAWQLCNHDEKMMEIAVACSLDIILYHALLDKIVVPNPEDVTLKHGVFGIRDAKIAKFVSWYAGGEDTDRIPGHSPPTLQRTVFAETWETRCVKFDPFVLESLVDNEYPVPQKYYFVSSRLRGSMDSIKVPSDETFYNPLLELYQDTVGKPSGTFLRMGLLARHLSTIIGCRRAALLRWMWPPGAARTGRQFLFPKMGLITPPFDLPARRIKPFPSRRPDAYTHQEMIAWYPTTVLDEDDALMKAGEVEGVRMRSYHNWLAQEKERQELTRKQMLQEDFDGHMRREINKEVEFRLTLNAQKLKHVVEHARDEDPDKEIELKFAASLPSEYWYIFEESQEYKYGSGIHNEDEMEEYREAERQRARNAEIEAQKFENYLQEEIYKREQEELARQKREEQDRRLAEGVARRRRLREHLEDLKRQRVARADEVERQRVEGEKRRQEELAIAEYNRQKEREKQNEIARCQREQQLMNIEDVLVTDNRARNRELKRMEHEDIRSFMREQYEIREKVQLKERYEALGELYKAFEPFPAKLAGDHMRTLQGLLQHDQSVAQVYLDVMDTLSQSSSHRSRVAEHSTDSVDRKRSVRYRRIFEGQLDNDLEVLPEGEGEESPTKSVLSNADGREQSARTLKALLPKHDPAHPPVRTLHHSPTKHSIRKNSALVPNKYDAQWIMFQNNPAQCFVRTSAETFPVPSESNAARRTMSALGPIIPSLQANTSLFEPAIATSGNDHAPHRDTRGAHPSAHQVTKTSFESDILQKFGASPSTLPKPGSVYADSFFDDSIQLESRSSLIPFARAPNELQPPAPQATTSQSDCQTFSQILFENTGEGIDKDMVDPYSQTVPSSDMRQMSFNPAGSTASGQLADFTASFDSSMFRSLSSVEEDKRSGIKNGKGSKSGGGGRKKLKDLLSTSADILAKSNEKEWLQYLETQRKATFASLSTLDAKADAAKRRIEKLTASATATFSDSAGAAGIEQIKIGGRPVEGNSSSSARPITPGGLSEMREKKQQVAQLKKELQELGIVDESILDFRTRQLAKAASESAIRMKAEKAMLRQYVGSSAVLHDEFYLMAVKPGDRHTTSLEVSEEVKKFAENVTRHVDGEELMFPSISSAEAVAPALPSRSTKVRTPAATRVTPKANLKFGHYQPAGDLFIETAEKAPEPKEPAVTLDLGVTSLTRNSSAQGNPVPVVRSVKKRMSKAKAASEALLPNIPSLLSISTLSASQSGLLPSFEPNISNPLGVIRGNPVSVAKEAPVVRHRKAFYDPSKSAASALQPPPPQQSSSTMSMSLAESTHGELAKKDSTISKSVELFINTPSASRRSMRKSSKGSFGVDDESVGSSTGFSPVDQRYPDLQPFEPEYRARGGGSIASAGSASIFLD